MFAKFEKNNLNIDELVHACVEFQDEFLVPKGVVPRGVLMTIQSDGSVSFDLTPAEALAHLEQGGQLFLPFTDCVDEVNDSRDMSVYHCAGGGSITLPNISEDLFPRDVLAGFAVSMADGQVKIESAAFGFGLSCAPNLTTQVWSVPDPGYFVILMEVFVDRFVKKMTSSCS